MPFQLKKNVSAKFKSPSRIAGKSRKEEVNSLSNKLSVNEEYEKTFKSKSYVEMWSKVQDKLIPTSTGRSLSSPSSSLPLYVHLSEYLLEPQQETLVNMIESLNFHHLLIDYFEASFEVCKLCELLLQSVHQTRANYRRISRVIKLTKRIHVDGTSNYTDEQSHEIYGELAAFALLKNPLSLITQVQFRDIHDSNMMLLSSLTSKCKKIRKRAKFHRVFKRVGGYALVVSHTALVITLLVLALHSVVGIVAAPGILACYVPLIKKRTKMAQKQFKTSLLERLGGQLDLAAKGTYILINNFDTMSHQVRRLYDEVEHGKAIADMCVKNGKTEVLKEVVKEFQAKESCFQEQLDELENHICLCFLIINRYRRLVIEETIVPQQ